MSLLAFSTPHTALSHSFCTSSPSLMMLSSAPPVSRFNFRPINLYPKCSLGVRFHRYDGFHRRGFVIVNANSDTDGTAPEENGTAESEEKAVSVDKLPLESKLQEKAEQKLRMKLAKKIRLRRKRLVRKRRLRKKGRWPPSKMKKLKNV